MIKAFAATLLATAAFAGDYNWANQGADWADSTDPAYVEACAGTQQSPIDLDSSLLT